MYKAVFLDLDDTLLDSNKNISEENKEAIEYAKQKGGLVCIASGRSIEITKKYRNLVNASTYVIYSNGAGIFDCDANEKLFSADIEKEIVLELYDYSVKNTTFNFLCKQNIPHTISFLILLSSGQKCAIISY